MFEIFKALCEARGESPSKVIRKLGFSTSLATEWKNGSHPRDDKIAKICDYFGVSEEFLRTGKEKARPEDALDRQLVEMLKKLPPEKVQRVLDFVQGLLSV